MIISTTALGASAIAAAGSRASGIVSALPKFTQVAVGNLIQVEYVGSIVNNLPNFSQNLLGSSFTIITADNITSNISTMFSYAGGSAFTAIYAAGISELPNMSTESIGNVFTVINANMVSTLPNFHNRGRIYINTTPPDLIFYTTCVEGEILEIPGAEYTCL